MCLDALQGENGLRNGDLAALRRDGRKKVEEAGDRCSESLPLEEREHGKDSGLRAEPLSKTSSLFPVFYLARGSS